ncbi:MocR-like pyridoxine biosynthesis transcription factor PdxR [Streptomyces narbonensis]|uniref:MocR-like pyridoxine biosynthesis transcription factor PdxR n=1 Tax=Streptomyces narbonensis TaxID=67333 RepID=UPI001673AB6A|nr:PLP-dependent aminotransferase family protein [Streptomyces narbonensis]GGV96879.1 GntR family transcriptional regulator [Streptomyces narbonensis]
MNGTVDGRPGGLGVDLHLELGAGGSRRAVLTEALREAVRGGRLAPGTLLPPYRSLAADLGIARNTVADAYAELVAEGWLTSRQGSGTRVAERVLAPAPGPARPVAPAALPYDLVQGKPDPGAFPRSAWLAAARRALTAAPHEAFGVGDPRGRIELRRALAAYLARVRGVRTTPDRIVVCSGTAHALRLLARVPLATNAREKPARQTAARKAPPRPWAVEAYGLPYHQGLLGEAGIHTLPLAVDEDGARIAEIPPEAGTVLLTPAHQFPTGGPLHPERRAGVLEWARRSGGLVVEDDYDGEFRYDRRPVGAVQSLDPDRTVLLGSVSKSLSPALRIGWMCLPEALVDGVLEAKGVREPHTSATEQLTLAEFVESGAYDRHVRRMRQQHRVRRDRLASVLAERVPRVRVTGLSAGLHALVELPPGTERAAVAAAARHGVAVEGLADYRHPEALGPALPDGLVVGYATPPDRLYPAALEALCQALSTAL